MPTNLPPAVTNRVKLLLDYDHPASYIATELSLSKRTVERLRLSFELFNQPYPPILKRRGRPPALDEHQKKVLLEYMDTRPEAGLEECVEVLKGLGVECCGSTVWRYLAKAGWGKKPAGKKKVRAIGEGEYLEEGRRAFMPPPPPVEARADDEPGEGDVEEGADDWDDNEMREDEEEEEQQPESSHTLMGPHVDPGLSQNVAPSASQPPVYHPSSASVQLTPLEQCLSNTWQALLRTNSPEAARGSPLWLEIASHLPPLVGLPPRGPETAVAPTLYQLPEHLAVPPEQAESMGRGKGAGSGKWKRVRDDTDEANEERKRIARERLQKGLRLT